VGTLNYRLVLAVALSCNCARSAAGAEFEKHFDGPYKLTTTASKRVRATVKSTYRFPNMVAQEWWVAYPLPPEFPGQPSARGRIRVNLKPAVQPGRIADDSTMRQPLITLHWFPASTDDGQRFTVDAIYELTINGRTLVPGLPAEPVTSLTRAERSVFLASSNHFDFTSPKFRAWLGKNDLKRKPGERDLDFAYRAMEAMVKTYTYRFDQKSDRSASAVCIAGWSDCGGLSTVYVSILRANGIPARCLSGRTLKPDGPHIRMDFYSDGVGWVPGDPSVAIAENSADAGFGHERPDMVIMHFDLIRFQHQYHWLQGIGIVRSINVNDEGSTAGMSLEAAMTVEELSVGDEAAPGASRSDGSRKRETTTGSRRAH
jgi:transglutaminase-like putative cysteine protease